MTPLYDPMMSSMYIMKCPPPLDPMMSPMYLMTPSLRSYDVPYVSNVPLPQIL